MGGNQSQRFQPNWLVWDVDRPNRSFRAYVVEPRTVDPPRHASMFWAAIQAFLPRPSTETEIETTLRGPLGRDHFDLLTFPEAFLPSDALLKLLSLIAGVPLGLGCIHVGLRPPNQRPDATHLFAVDELRELVAQLGAEPSVVSADLAGFKSWLDQQNANDRFNIGCLFTLDAEQRVRICLHAKLVKSKFEVHPEHDRNMTEANLLSLVTLRPANRDLSSITIQPLICSDILKSGTAVLNNHPIPAITSHRSCFEQVYADEVDVVSVATLTPNSGSPAGMLAWHQEFRDSFVRAASDDGCQRHHRAAFFLSNFRFTRPPASAPGGLSGAFIPLPMFASPHDQYVSKSMCVFGHFTTKRSDVEKNRWVSRDTKWEGRSEQPVLGYILGLDPATLQEKSAATMFGFTLSSLPRGANRWTRTDGASDFAVYDAMPGKDEGQLQFTKRGGQ